MYGFRDAVHQKLWDGNFREMEKLNICILFHAFMQLSLLWKGNFHFDRQNIHVGPQVLCCFWVSVALPVTWGAPQYGGPGHGIIQPMNQVAMTHASWLSTQCTSSSWPGGPQCPWDGNQNGQVKSNLTWFFFYHSIGTYCCCFSVAKSCLTFLWTAAYQASLSFIISQSLLRLMSIEPVMPSNHLILSPFSPLAFNLSQHQHFFQCVCSSH